MKTSAEKAGQNVQREPASSVGQEGQSVAQRGWVPQLGESPRMAAQRQAVAHVPEAAQRVESPNATGMPDQLKAGIESLSGMDMSDVRVHANSDKPAQLNALAYAQGNDIHLAAGQERHLPHEAWHVVQQRQGRVQATMQMAGVGINDDDALEKEADSMGDRAAAFTGSSAMGRGAAQRVAAPAGVAQRATRFLFKMRTLDYDDGSGMAKTTDVGEQAEAWIDPSNPVAGTETPKRAGVFADLDLIQGHLVNAQVGGPGINQNFFPITASMNSNHKNNIELPLKYKVLELNHLQQNQHGWANRHLYYKVSVTPPRWNGFTKADAQQTVFNTALAYTNAQGQLLNSLGTGVGGITASDAANLIHETLDTRLSGLGMGASKPTSPSFGVGKTYTQGVAVNPLLGYKANSYYLMKGGAQIGIVEPP